MALDPVRVLSLKDVETEASKALGPEEPSKFKNLDGQLNVVWGVHRDTRRKSGVETSMVESVRAFLSKYTTDKQSTLNSQGMSTVYYGLTGDKCRAAMAWLIDAFIGEGEKPWRLASTPLPGVPNDMAEIARAAGVAKLREYAATVNRELTEDEKPAVTGLVQTAIETAVDLETQKRIRKMEKLIDDQLVEGGWSEAFRDFLFDLVVLKAGIIKGPVLREVKRKKWSKSVEKPKLGFEWGKTLTVSRVSPFDAYPASSTVGFEGDFIERTRYSLADLFWMKKQDHFFRDQVAFVIDNFTALAGADVDPVDQDWAAALQGQTGEDSVKDTVEGLDFWLAVTGHWLKQAGWSSLPNGKKVEDAELYNIEAITVSGRVVFLGILDDPLDRKPYYKTGWFPVPGSFWYQGLPEVLKDIQDISSAAARSLVNNMGLASGFQIIIPDAKRVAGGEITTIFPHKVWQFANKMNSSVPPIDFKQPESNAGELMGIINQCKKWADDVSGVPAYMLGGEQPPGVGRTAAGISMLLNSAAKGIRRVVLDIDRNVVKPLIERFYDWNLEHSEDPGIKGDAEVVPAGAVEVMIKAEAADRQLKMLEAMNNPVDLQLVGLRGRAELWRAALRSVDLAGHRLIKDDAEVEQMARVDQESVAGMKAAQQQQMEADVRLKQADLQLKQAQLALEQQRLQTEAQLAAMKLEAMKSDSDQRAAITRRMAANADYKTLKELGAENVPEGFGQERPVSPAEGGAPAGMPAPVPVAEGLPAGTGLPPEAPGGELPPASPGGGPVA